MRSAILALFPSQTHPLTLVSDPDHLLAGEALLTELINRGFRIIQEDDPVLLRHQVEEAQPFTSERPVILITTGALEDFPYDLYQPAHRIQLSLHRYFPNLAYPVLKTLSPDQIEKLETSPQPGQTLSRQKTMDYLLKQVFSADPSALDQPHTLIAWLVEYHHHRSPLPELLLSTLVEQLQKSTQFQGWNIGQLIRDSQAFQSFMQQQWRQSVEGLLNQHQMGEPGPAYWVSFQSDPHIQDLVPTLVRSGILHPLQVASREGVPGWMAAGVTIIDPRLERFSTLLDNVEKRLVECKSLPPSHSGWEEWCMLAFDWAELCSYYQTPRLDILPHHKDQYLSLVCQLDSWFSDWLTHRYPFLGSQRLPKPHHVFHVPHYIDYIQSIGQVERFVLLVLDGCSLADWQIINPAWKARHPDWDIHTETVLAQVPSITSISRYSLISGLHPADFVKDENRQPPESRAWELFWSRKGFPETTGKLLSLAYDRNIDHFPELMDPRIIHWCLVDDTLDRIAHHATLGATEQQASLRLWLDSSHEKSSLPLEAILGDFLQRGYTVFISSDHGHVEAVGFGQPSEGLLTKTRGQRARIYPDRTTAQRTQSAFPETVLWDNDGLLPNEWAVLMPARRNAFAHSGEITVTHGGITMEEIFVPLIMITKARD